MAVLTCPGCKASLKFQGSAPPGAVARCPGCKGVVPLPSHTSGEATATYQPRNSPDATSLEPHKPGHRAGPVLDFLAPPQAPGELGRLGAYRVTGRLGHGGMGMVLRAEDPQLKRSVALKVMLPRYASDAAAKARFLREARSQAQVEHDHVIAVFQVGEDNGVPYLAMPLLKGQTLGATLSKSSRPPLAEVVRIGREVAEGLAAAHEVGLIHRDIKPSNIWLEGGRRRVKILDFGLARAESSATEALPFDPEQTEADGAITMLGAIVGTPLYMSPEQARGQSVDARTDLFSLGVVLYQMATGELPFTGGSSAEILAAVTDHRPPPPIALNADLPAALSDLIVRLLAKFPVDRPPSAEKVAEELEAIAEGLKTNAAPVPTALAVEDDPWADVVTSETIVPEIGRKSDPVLSKRRSWVPIACAAAGVVLLIGLGVAARKLTRPTPSPVEPEPDPKPVVRTNPQPKKPQTPEPSPPESVIQPPQIPPGRKHPEELNGIRSAGGQGVRQVFGIAKVVNKTDATLRIYWIDFQGRRDLRSGTGPQGMIELKTFVGHVWLLADNDDNALHVFRLGSENETFEFTQAMKEEAEKGFPRIAPPPHLAPIPAPSFEGLTPDAKFDFANGRQKKGPAPGKEDTHAYGYANKAFFVEAVKGGMWWRSIGTSSESFAIEVRARVASPNGMWVLSPLYFPVGNDRVALLVNLDNAGSLHLSGWKLGVGTDSLPEERSISHRAIRKGSELNKLLFVCRDGKMELYVNGEQIAEPIPLREGATPWPAQIGVSANGFARAEFDQVTIWHLPVKK